MEEAYMEGERALCRNLEDECKSREDSKCKGTGERLGTVCLRSRRRPEGLLGVEQGERGNEVRKLAWTKTTEGLEAKAFSFCCE